MSEIYPIHPQSVGLIIYHLKGRSAKTIGFQGMVLMQILISMTFPFQRCII